jgi:pilus assembly protein CpaE
VVHNEAQVLALYHTRQGAERLQKMVAGSAIAKLQGLENSQEEFERKAVQQQPQIMLVEFSADENGLPDLLERLRRSVPRGAVVAAADSQDPELIITAMRLGVREFLTQDDDARAFNEAALRFMRQIQTSAQPAGSIISVIGVKGGVGASHLALNLGWCLSQQQGQRVALVDLDLAGGDLSFLLDLTPERNLVDVARNFERLDPLFMDSLLSEVAPGLRLLSAPTDAVAAEDVTPEHVGRALEELAQAHAMVVVDLPSRIDDVTLLALDQSNLILMLMEPTLVGLKAARRMQGLSRQLGHDPEKVHFLVNRFGSKGSLSKADVKKVLEADVLHWLPNDSRTIMSAGNAGRPVLRDWPRSPWAKSMLKTGEAVAELLSQEEEE